MRHVRNFARANRYIIFRRSYAFEALARSLERNNVNNPSCKSSREGRKREPARLELYGM